jgi:hypothetical protein
MDATHVADIENIKKLNAPIRRIVVELENFELIVIDNMAFWLSLNPRYKNYKLERKIFVRKDRITQAIDHYNEVMKK